MRFPWLLCLILYGSAQAADKKLWVYVNGGFSPSSNTAVHETNLLAFKENLFGERFLVFSGGGPKGPVVALSPSGHIEVDDKGYPKRLASRLTFPFSSARRSDLMSLFEKMAGGDFDAITMVIADHGGPQGVLLWEDHRALSANELHGLHASLSEHTLARTIYLQCYGGATMVEAARRLPAHLSEWPGFLKRYYRARGCGLSLSGADEVGQYFDDKQETRQGRWAALLTKDKRTTLHSLKTAISGLSDFKPIPLLTSDFLANDLAEYFCRKEESPLVASAPNLPPFASAPGATPSADPISAIEGNPCQRDPRLGRVNAATALATKKYLAWLGALSTAADVYCEKKYPKEMGSYRQIRDQIAEIQEKFAKAHPGRPTITEQRQLELDVFSAKGDFYYEMEMFVGAIARGHVAKPEFEAFVKSAEFAELFAKDTRHSLPVRKLVAQILKSRPAAAPWRITAELQYDMEYAQAARASAFKGRQARVRAFVATRLLAPEFGELRDFYHGMLQCEDSDLR